MPAVYYSTRPAELILFRGTPTYAEIPGTRLQYATNTMSYFFLYTPAHEYFYLTAGRWFSARNLAGPWTFATPDLPSDFAKIPPGSPAAQVRASVPGTKESEDAILMSKIPATAIVDPVRAAASVKVIYAGEPQFAPIEGTPLYYATNTAEKVIKAGDLYYLCLQGIWFVSTGPQGPWRTADSVPQVIYTIPPGSPVYNVTYVTQITSPDGSVQASYTAGYLGVFVMGVSAGAVIVCGTGYYYPPYVAVSAAWVYPVYYPAAYTYGARTYFYPATGAYGVSQTIYGPYGSASRTAFYNPYTGTYGRTASVSTPYGTSKAGLAYNPYTGAYAGTRQGSNAYVSWSSSVVSIGGQSVYSQHYSTARGSMGRVETGAGGKAAVKTGVHGATGIGKSQSGDVYADHNGNIYRNTGSGWQKYENNNWTPVQRPSQKNPQQQLNGGQSFQQSGTIFQRSGRSGQMEELRQDEQNRQRGLQESQRFQQYQHSTYGSGISPGFGGFRRGGGMRRGGR